MMEKCGSRFFFFDLLPLKIKKYAGYCRKSDIFLGFQKNLTILAVLQFLEVLFEFQIYVT